VSSSNYEDRNTADWSVFGVAEMSSKLDKIHWLQWARMAIDVLIFRPTEVIKVHPLHQPCIESVDNKPN